MAGGGQVSDGTRNVSEVSSRRGRGPNFTEEERRRMQVLYLHHGMTCAEVAEVTGTCRQSVYSVLVRLGTPMRPKGRVPKKS